MPCESPGGNAGGGCRVLCSGCLQPTTSPASPTACPGCRKQQCSSLPSPPSCHVHPLRESVQLCGVLADPPEGELFSMESCSSRRCCAGTGPRVGKGQGLCWCRGCRAQGVAGSHPSPWVSCRLSCPASAVQPISEAALTSSGSWVEYFKKAQTDLGTFIHTTEQLIPEINQYREAALWLWFCPFITNVLFSLFTRIRLFVRTKSTVFGKV